jgi:acetyl esterase/lipase
VSSIDDMSISWLFLAVALWGAWFTWNAYRPIYRPAGLATVSFFAGWLTSELALHHILWQLAFTALFIWFGALAAGPGWVALAIVAASWIGLWRAFVNARTAEGVVERALVAGLGADYRERVSPGVQERLAPEIDWRRILLPFPMSHPEVERLRNIEYTREGGRPLHLDVYRRKDRPTGCPTILQIHGGAWILGSKNEQGIPLMLELASRGWVCVNANYRLSPRATFPDPLVDLKRAIAWIREHGAEYGADPDFLVVTGGSAGGHLSSLVALTANCPEYQPGFEHVDTSVRACVPFYGVYDFTDRHGHYRNPGLVRLLERQVMKKRRTDDPEAWERASPMSCVTASAPPFFVIHGDRDTLVPVDEARRFVETLAKSGVSVAYAEVPGAQHAFEIFPSLRTTFVIHGVERYLAYVYGEYLAARSRPAEAATA